jgi:hypothetical protein
VTGAGRIHPDRFLGGKLLSVQVGNREMGMDCQRVDLSRKVRPQVHLPAPPDLAAQQQSARLA